MKTNVYIKDHLGSNRVIVSSIDEVTDTAVSQTIGHITATANTVQTDISTPRPTAAIPSASCHRRAMTTRVNHHPAGIEE